MHDSRFRNDEANELLMNNDTRIGHNVLGGNIHIQ